MDTYLLDLLALRRLQSNLILYVLLIMRGAMFNLGLRLKAQLLFKFYESNFITGFMMWVIIFRYVPQIEQDRLLHLPPRFNKENLYIIKKRTCCYLCSIPILFLFWLCLSCYLLWFSNNLVRSLLSARISVISYSNTIRGILATKSNKST